MISSYCQLTLILADKLEKAFVGRQLRQARTTPLACCTPARRAPVIAAGDRMRTNERAH